MIIGIVTDIKISDNKTILTVKSKENILVYYYNKISLNLGDKIKITGNLKQFSNNTYFNLFNYKKYMLSKNTYYSMNALEIELIKKNKNLLYRLKSKLTEVIKNKKSYQYLNTFIMGKTSDIDSKILDSYRTNGISHLFSVSGMHITLLTTIILYILNKIKKSNINYIFSIIFLIFYMFLTNFTPSVIRATFLFIFITLNKLLKLNLTTIRIISIIICIVLLINPYNIYNVGFKFSYIISIFLIVFSKIINRNNNYLKKTIATSFISFLASIPILINNFFSINLLTVLNNLIFVPLVSFIIFPFSLITLFVPKIDIIYEFLIKILENLSLFLSNYKIELILCRVNIVVIIFYYILIIFILYKILKKRYKYILIIIIILFIHTNINYIQKSFYITFLDVGQGDSVFFHYNKKNILIDTGGNINYNNSKNIISYLKSEGIKEIDYLILTHGDYDHMGEAINLVNNFKINKVIFNCGNFNELEQNLIQVLEKKKIQYYSCIKELNIYDNKLYFLNNKDYGSENDNSNVIYTKFNNYRFLFMGDAGVEVEKELIEKYNLKNIDVLKVGHHGSKTSSSEFFIDEIKPKYSIISVGKNNKYGHPNDSVLENLKTSKTYRTDQYGSIMLKIKNNKLKISICAP